MTRKETEEALEKLKAEWNPLMESKSSVWRIVLLEMALKSGVDPETVCFGYEIEEGKGTKWDE